MRRRSVWLAAAVFGACVIIFLTLTFISLQKLDIMTSTLAEQSLPVIVIDAGHGGEDGGASSSSGILEKDINLAVSIQLRDMLKVAGFPVVMTRDKDISINDEGLSTIKERKVSDLHNRLRILNEQGDRSILVSIHQNHFSESKYYGSQVFYSSNDAESSDLAKKIRSQIIQLLQPENTREIKPTSNSIYLLWNAEVPAVIVECGFLSNESEAQKLSEPQYQKQMAFAIFNGILNYYADRE